MQDAAILEAADLIASYTDPLRRLLSLAQDFLIDVGLVESRGSVLPEAGAVNEYARQMGCQLREHALEPPSRTGEQFG